MYESGDLPWRECLRGVCAKKVEDEFGKENLGPGADFEWGMLNGRLLELRWAVGNEELYLDT
jgi:hypothetical protein